MRTLSARARLLSTLGAPVAALLLLESGLRVAAFEHRPEPVPPVVWRTADEQGSLHRADDWSLWSPRPGAPIGNSGECINAAGFRGPDPASQRAPGTLRVVLLGESSIFGIGVPWTQSCAPQLERLLGERGVRAEVINAGVLGHTLPQGLERYRSVVRALRPDVACVAFGALNEFSPCQGLSDVEKLALARQHRAASAAPDLWTRLSGNLRVLQLIDSWRARPDLEALLAPRPTGQDGPDEICRLDWPGCRRVPRQDFEVALDELVQTLQADGVRPLLVSLPRHPAQEDRRPIQAAYSQSIEQAGQRWAIRVVDARAAVRDAAASGTDPAAFFISENAFHLGPRGQLLLATLLADGIAPPR